MNYSVIHPSVQIAEAMTGIYMSGRTTTSGGNISMIDSDGRLWMTPTSIDKATLRAEDIACLLPDGTCLNKNKPSSEWKFHSDILRVRPEFKAVVHAHSSALMAYSFIRQLPPVDIFPRLKRHIGNLVKVGYAKPGSKLLSDLIREAFENGCDAAVLDNHGIVVGGTDLQDAMARFEEIELCADITLKALGFDRNCTFTAPEDVSDARAEGFIAGMDILAEHQDTPEECEARELVARLSRRVYERGLCTAFTGSFSVRAKGDSFVTTQRNVFRGTMNAEDTILVRGNAREAGKAPDVSLELHAKILADHPEINFVVMGDAPGSLGYALAGQSPDFRTIPEGFFVVRNLTEFEYGAWANDPESVSAILDKTHHVFLFKNDCLLSCGKGWFDSFDSLEVTDYSTKCMSAARSAGELQLLTPQQMAEFN